MAPVIRPDNIIAKVGELEAALRRLETSDKVSNSTVTAATIWFSDGSATQITIGKQADGTYGIDTIAQISANDIQTAGGQRLKFFAQPTDPGAADADPNVTRVWFQTS